MNFSVTFSSLAPKKEFDSRLIGLGNRLFGLVSRVRAYGPGDLGSSPGRVISKTLKMVLDTTLLNTQHY